MIDHNFNPWLIEINTNPDLDSKSMVLSNLIPKMVNDAL